MRALLRKPDIRRGKACLAGQAVEDLTCEPLLARRYRAELLKGPSKHAEAHYKDGGFFAFAELLPGDYTLRIRGRGLESKLHEFSVPEREEGVPIEVEEILVEEPLQNEEFVRVAGLPEGSPDGGRVAIDPILIRSPIPQGAAALAGGFASRLRSPLQVGLRKFVSLVEIAPLKVGDLLRLVRTQALRMRFDPYADLPVDALRLVGRVTSRTSGQPLPGARVRLSQWGGQAVGEDVSAGAPLFTFQDDGTTRVLGARQDVEARANERGDYHLYFQSEPPAPQVQLTASRPGFQSKSRIVELDPEARRVKVDFGLGG